MSEQEETQNTIFEQDGKVYAVCSHHVPPKDLAKFIHSELYYAAKHVPRFKMRIISTEQFRALPFGAPSKE